MGIQTYHNFIFESRKKDWSDNRMEKGTDSFNKYWNFGSEVSNSDVEYIKNYFKEFIPKYKRCIYSQGKSIYIRDDERVNKFTAYINGKRKHVDYLLIWKNLDEYLNISIYTNDDWNCEDFYTISTFAEMNEFFYCLFVEKSI